MGIAVVLISLYKHRLWNSFQMQISDEYYWTPFLFVDKYKKNTNLETPIVFGL